MLNVLLIEDHDSHGEMIGNELRDMGYVVTVWSSLAEVRKQMLALANPPSGILLDLQIPEEPGRMPALENGRDCAALLRGNRITAAVPIIAYTAFWEDRRIPGWEDVFRFCAVLRKGEDRFEAREAAYRRCIG
jgi:CheY-like chemotaxis protein